MARLPNGFDRRTDGDYCGQYRFLFTKWSKLWNKYEIEGVVAHYKKQHGELNVFICGGDANFFESLTKDYIFVIPNLILHGLNRILIYNVNKK
ncbi:MAG: hypothetical protein WD426_02575 [Anditalea sp.]